MTVADTSFINNDGKENSILITKTNSKSEFSNCSFDNNKNSNRGGAIFLDSDGAQVDVSASTFFNNEAIRGGAVFCHINSVF